MVLNGKAIKQTEAGPRHQKLKVPVDTKGHLTGAICNNED